MHELSLKVPDMTCGHCVGAIQRAVEVIDGVSEVEASLETKVVNIKSSRDLDTAEVLAVVTGAGYSPEVVR